VVGSLATLCGIEQAALVYLSQGVCGCGVALREVIEISDPLGLCLREVQNEVEGVSDNVRTHKIAFSMGLGDVTCCYRWARK
jgi:hypothetical protein